MKTTTPRRPSDDVWRCCQSTHPDAGTDLGDFGMVRACGVGLGREPGGTKQLYEVGPAAPFEKRTVAVSGNASETSPCRRAGQSKRRARHPSGERRSAGELRRNRDLRESGATAGEPRRLSSFALGRRAASVGPLQVVDDPVTGPGANPKPYGVRRVPQRDCWAPGPQEGRVCRGRR
jgi:hypothetical protein